MILQSVPRSPMQMSGALLVFGAVVLVALAVTGVYLLISSATRRRFR